MTGPFFAIFAALLFGLSSPIAKTLLGTIDPWLLAGLLYLGAGLGMAGVFVGKIFLSGKLDRQSIRKADLPWLAGVTFFGGILGPVLLMYGLNLTAASTASLLLNLEGVFTALLAWIAFREHYDRRIVFGMAAIIAVGAVLSWPGSFGWKGAAGPLLVAAACLCWAVDNNFTRKISLNDPILLTLLKGLVAGTTNLLIALRFGARLPLPLGIAEAGVIGFLCYGLSIVCFILALRKLGASRTGAYFSTAPFVGAVLSIVFLHEPLTANLFAAAAFMGFGIYLHLSETHEHPHTHEELQHDHFHTHDEHHQHAHGPGDPPGEAHTHAHRHTNLTHSHRHFPDMHHQHSHSLGRRLACRSNCTVRGERGAASLPKATM